MICSGVETEKRGNALGKANVRLCGSAPLGKWRTAIPLFLLTWAVTPVRCFGDPAPPQQPANESSPLQASADSPVRVMTRLVQISVIVNDKRGNPIVGLTQRDFSVFDNKSEQQIQVFSADKNPATGAREATVPPNTFTNRLEDGNEIPRSVTVILLDALNTDAADQALARAQVFKALRDLGPHEPVALYWLGDELHILHEFSTDSAVLRGVMAEFKPKTSRELANSEVGDPSLNNPNPSTPAGNVSEREAFRRTFDQRVANQSSKSRVRITVGALIAIANHLSSVKGRKNLVWISGSFPINLGYNSFDLDWSNDTGESFKEEVEKAARALANANMAVYPVDARGLQSSVTGAATDTLGEHIGDPTDSDSHLPTRDLPGSTGTMKLLASRTGGKAFYGTNDIAGAIRQAIDDSRVTYTLGFYPQGINWDGSFHRIRVRVHAVGAEVHAREGYFAFPETSPRTAASDRALIGQVAASGLPATGITLRVQVQGKEASGVQTLIVQPSLDLRGIEMQSKDDHWKGALQFAFVQLDQSGQVVQSDEVTFQLNLDAATYSKVMKTGVADSREVRVAANATDLCVITLDLSNGNMGSVYVQISRYFHGPLRATGNQDSSH